MFVCPLVSQKKTTEIKRGMTINESDEHFVVNPLTYTLGQYKKKVTAVHIKPASSYPCL